MESKKIDCVFQVSEQFSLNAMAHLFEHKYAGRIFWFGVAQFDERTDKLPIERVIRLSFDDGRIGYVTIRDGKMSADGYFEVAFIGMDELKDVAQS